MYSPLDLQVYVRNSGHQIIGQLDDFTRVQLVMRYNAISNWVLNISATDRNAALLAPGSNPNGGLIFKLYGTTLLSGPIHTFGYASDADGTRKLTVAGPDDTQHLANALVWPDPAHAIDSQATAYYEVTNSASSTETLMKNLVNLNLGPGALTERRKNGLTVETSSNRGKTGQSFKYRFETVLDALTEIARGAPIGTPSGYLGFRIRQKDTSAEIEFQVYSTTNRRDTATFSEGRGNLVSSSYQVTAPTMTYAVLGAGRSAVDGAENAAAVAKELFGYTRVDTQPVFPSYRVEGFVDVGEVDPTATDAQAQLDEKSQDALYTGATSISVSMDPQDTDQLTFAKDYFLGDQVTVVVPYAGVIQEQVREAELTFDASNGLTTEITVGTEATTSHKTSGATKRLNTLADMVKKLNTRK
ncbi:siphovirus ReqiPepy6 Gp37-like family protein [Streptomyces sp. NPDC017966]|uniref:siphovirus ReqiPepy6 Gp37-like family protein n=1 Tax=Streptomyces sp. NPDC017966 TaxID=3365023 RepID=UPI0037921B13